MKLHYHLDHLGTPRGITQETGPGEGEGVGAYHYWPYGTPGPTSNLAPFAELVRDQVVPGAFDPATEVMRFTGHERDFGSVAGTEDDLDYMHARFYRPGWGRFLSVDPVVLRQATRGPGKWNRYAYAIGNPLKLKDPDGRTAIVFVIEGASPFLDPEGAFGHAALVVDQNGRRGVVNQGTPQELRSVATFVNGYLREGRTVTAFKFKDDPQRDERLLAATDRQQKKGVYDERRQNCATHCGDVLRGAGMLDSDDRPERGLLYDSPELLGRSLERGVLAEDVEIIYVFHPLLVQEVYPEQIEIFFDIPDVPGETSGP